MHRNVLRAFKMLAGNPAHSLCEITMSEIIGSTRIAGNYHSPLPLSAAVPRLFPQLALGRLERLFARVNHAGAQFVARLAYAMAVLPYHDELAAVSNGKDIHPVRIFQNIKLVVDIAVRQFHRVAPCRQPRTAYEIFTFERLPFMSIIFLSMFFHTAV